MIPVTRSPFARHSPQGWLSGLALVCALAAHAAPAWAAACPPKCASVSSVVHAAGVLRVGPLGQLDHAGGELMWRLHVDAATLAPLGIQLAHYDVLANIFHVPGLTQQALADEINALPAKAVVKLKVGADSSLSGAAAKRQATARAAALRTALKKGGLPAKRVSVAAAG